MEWDAPLCRYLHRSLQVLWFSVEEWYLLAAIYIGGLAGSAMIWLLFPIAVMVVFPYTRAKHRSYFKHAKVQLGLKPLHGYPPPISGRFYE